MSLTSTTAPGKTFGSRSELAEHYKSDWHKYNLKRREAGLPLLEEQEFQTRWEAALALRKEKEGKAQHSGTDHLKNKKNKAKKSSTTKKQQENVSKSNENTASDSATSSDVKMIQEKEDGVDEGVTTEEEKSKSQKMKEELAASQENPDIDPKQSLFDSHTSDSLEQNLQYMQEKYGFFVPDRECLRDLNGLLGYCHEKIKLGHYCLFCEKIFPTWQGCQKHMISKQHTKLKYEPGTDWEELDPFYDFDKDNSTFVGANGVLNTTRSAAAETQDDTKMDEGNDDEEEGGWEDMSDDGEDMDVDDDEEVYNAYQQEIARFGLDVTPLGELVFPDGRIVGHRALRKYYKQRARPEQSSTAIVAAKDAAGERLYEGRVVNIGTGFGGQQKAAGNGILVKSEGGGFSALSLYRFRAAVQKQRRDDAKGRRLQQRTTQNINRMDKKANRLMNGVSVAHAAR